MAGETSWATYTPHAPEAGKLPGNGFVLDKEGVEGHRDGKFWMPAECDVSIRPGWFYHENQDTKVKSPATLMKLYYNSVGHGACLDLGLSPNRLGLLADGDVKALADFGTVLKETFATNLAKGATVTASNIRGKNKALYGTAKLFDADRYSYWATDDKVLTPELIIDLHQPKTFNVIRLRENIKLGQRIDAIGVDAFVDGIWQEVATATSIGGNRTIRLSTDVTASKVRLRIVKASASTALSDFGLYKEAPIPTE
jgi:alpha-L-fucosidase